VANAVEVIDAIGRIGAVAAVSSIIAVAVSQRFDLKRIDKQDAYLRSKEERDFKRAREQAVRDLQLKIVMDVQDCMWPLQEHVSAVQRVATGFDSLITGRDKVPAFFQESNAHSTANTRLEVLISRVADEELAKRAERCRTDLYLMYDAISDEAKVDHYRNQFTQNYRRFQDQARKVIHELMA
jgi:vacuolar-type H+-ATPase subunit I/STV1